MPTKQKMSSRQFKVAEQIRKVLAELFQKGSFHAVDVGNFVTISEVQITPDLKHTTVFVSPLGGTKEVKEFMAKMDLLVPEVRKAMASKLQLRYCPFIHFKYDDLYDKANHMELLFKSITHDDEDK